MSTNVVPKSYLHNATHTQFNKDTSCEHKRDTLLNSGQSEKEQNSASGCPPSSLYQDQRRAYSISPVYPVNMYTMQRKLDGGIEMKVFTTELYEWRRGLIQGHCF